MASELLKHVRDLLGDVAAALIMFGAVFALWRDELPARSASRRLIVFGSVVGFAAFLVFVALIIGGLL